MNTTLARNLQVLTPKDPSLARLIAHTSPHPGLTLAHTPHGETIPALTTPTGIRTLHSRIDPDREAQRLIKAQRPKGFCIVLGLGAGYHLKILLHTPEVHHILVLEHDPSFLAALLSLVDLSDILSHPRIHLLLDPSPDLLSRTISRLFIPSLDHTYTIIPLRSRTLLAPTAFDHLLTTTRTILDTLSSDHATQTRFGTTWMRNTLLNLPHLMRNTTIPPSPLASPSPAQAPLSSTPYPSSETTPSSPRTRASPYSSTTTSPPSSLRASTASRTPSSTTQDSPPPATPYSSTSPPHPRSCAPSLHHSSPQAPTLSISTSPHTFPFPTSPPTPATWQPPSPSSPSPTAPERSSSPAPTSPTPTSSLPPGTFLWPYLLSRTTHTSPLLSGLLSLTLPRIHGDHTPPTSPLLSHYRTTLLAHLEKAGGTVVEYRPGTFHISAPETPPETIPSRPPTLEDLSRTMTTYRNSLEDLPPLASRLQFDTLPDEARALWATLLPLLASTQRRTLSAPLEEASRQTLTTALRLLDHLSLTTLT